MKLAFLVPGPMDQGASRPEFERRWDILKRMVFPGTQIDMFATDAGAVSIESRYEEYLAIPAAIEKAGQLEKQGYDALIIGCAGDPGYDGMREMTSKMLVVAPGQASMAMAALLGNQFGVLTVTDGMMYDCRATAFKAGVMDKLAAVKALNLPITEIRQHREESLRRIIAAAREMVEGDRVDAITMACMSMGFLDITREIEAAVGVPVICPVRAGVKMAEAMVSMGLMHSKTAFPLPPKRA